MRTENIIAYSHTINLDIIKFICFPSNISSCSVLNSTRLAFANWIKRRIPYRWHVIRRTHSSVSERNPSVFHPCFDFICGRRRNIFRFIYYIDGMVIIYVCELIIRCERFNINWFIINEYVTQFIRTVFRFICNSSVFSSRNVSECIVQITLIRSVIWTKTTIFIDSYSAVFHTCFYPECVFQRS